MTRRTAGSAAPAPEQLADGTPCFAPYGQLLYDVDRDRVRCHLCGAWLQRLVPGHIDRVHGWEAADYADAFGLNATTPLQTPTLSAKQRATLRRRMAEEPSLARSAAAAQERMRTGLVERQTRPRAAEGRRNIGRGRSPEAKKRSAEGKRAGAAVRFEQQQQEAARRLGYASFASLYAALREQGLSLADVAREVGHDEDWVSRTPARAAERTASGGNRRATALTTRLRACAARAGYDTTGQYLKARVDAGILMKDLQQELGVSQKTLRRLLEDAGIPSAGRGRRATASQLPVDVTVS